MSSMDGALVYDFSGIDSMVGAIGKFVTEMEANLADIDQTFRNLLQNGWRTAGSEDFAGCSKQWWDSAEALRATLEDLSGRLGTAAGNMQSADRAAGARFNP